MWLKLEIVSNYCILQKVCMYFPVACPGVQGIDVTVWRNEEQVRVSCTDQSAGTAAS